MFEKCRDFVRILPILILRICNIGDLRSEKRDHPHLPRGCPNGRYFVPKYRLKKWRIRENANLCRAGCVFISKLPRFAYKRRATRKMKILFVQKEQQFRNNNAVRNERAKVTHGVVWVGGGGGRGERNHNCGKWTKRTGQLAFRYAKNLVRSSRSVSTFFFFFFFEKFTPSPSDSPRVGLLPVTDCDDGGFDRLPSKIVRPPRAKLKYF